MNNNSEFQKITKYVLLSGGSLDWNELYKTSLSVIFDVMARTRQNPAYHKEIDVLSHTKMVCEAMMEQPEYKNGSEADKTILFWSALLHDLGKPACTVEVDGVLKSPHHASKGAILARELLWKEFGLCGSLESQQIREAICNLINYHAFPPYAHSAKNAEMRLLKIASNGELVKGFSLAKLCALERADALGRICADGDDLLERVEYCRALCEEIGCLEKSYEFANDYSKRAYFKGKTAWREQDMFNDSWGTVILMSGLPGTGKDTYIAKKYHDMPMVSLDDIRKELKISPTDNQGRVISVGHERARELLRKKQPFVWNATNITAQTREMQIALFEDYGASVETVFLETEWSEQLNRNKNRAAEVPPSVIENMFSKLTLPERFESEKVRWEIV